MSFFDFTLIRQPNASPTVFVPAPARELLVVYQAGAEREAFLFGVLRAAGYARPQEEDKVHLCPLATGQEAQDLASLARAAGVGRILVFGLSLPALGFHLLLQPYHPYVVNGFTFMWAEDLAYIQSAKLAGNTEPASQLWGGIKAAFLHADTSSKA